MYISNLPTLFRQSYNYDFETQSTSTLTKITET